MTTIQYSKSTSRPPFQRPKHATGGPGMQAIFLGSGQGSCGTGVFLPQRAGTKPTKKPGTIPCNIPLNQVLKMSKCE